MEHEIRIGKDNQIIIWQDARYSKMDVPGLLSEKNLQPMYTASNNISKLVVNQRTMERAILGITRTYDQRQQLK